jgi:putative ABC transport system substrate-binding protein
MLPAARHRHVARLLPCLFALLLAAAPAGAQEPQPRRIGVFLWHDSANDLVTLQGIRAGLAAAGLAVEYHEGHAHSDAARGREELQRLRKAGVELVFAMGTQAVQLAAAELKDLPVVYGAVSNPVVSGIVPDWKGSGTNVAGASNWIPPATVLHAFRLAVPGLRRLGVLRTSKSGTVSDAEVKTMREHLETLAEPRIELVERQAADAAGIAACVEELVRAGVQALWIPIDITIYDNMPAVQAALGSRGIPLVTTAMKAAREGAAVGVVVDYELLGRRTAAIALQVLRDKREPGAIPVDTMRGYQVIVHPDAARKQGYELPLPLLIVADELVGPAPRKGR